MIDLGGHLADEVEDTDQQHDVCSLLEVLADDRTERILQELLTATEPLSAPELNDRCDIPQSTIYRRLDELTEHGVLRERRELDTEGQDITLYEVVIGGLDLELTTRGYHTTRHDRDDEENTLDFPSDTPDGMSLELRQ